MGSNSFLRILGCDLNWDVGDLDILELVLADGVDSIGIWKRFGVSHMLLQHLHNEDIYRTNTEGKCPESESGEGVLDEVWSPRPDESGRLPVAGVPVSRARETRSSQYCLRR